MASGRIIHVINCFWFDLLCLVANYTNNELLTTAARATSHQKQALDLNYWRPTTLKKKKKRREKQFDLKRLETMAFAATRMILKDKRRKPSLREDFSSKVMSWHLIATQFSHRYNPMNQ